MNFPHKLQITNHQLPIPLFFAVITVIAYGLLLPFTGFYWDDLPFAWIAKFLGPREFIPAFMPYRPFLAPIFYFTTSLVPPVPIYWQIFALVIRFIIGSAAFWTFKQIWREQPQRATIAALLVLIFPGYSQHWVAFTHINQELIPFIFYILSVGFTFKALETGKATHIIIALLLQICGIFPTEYFFGIEGLRFLFLFFYFEGNLVERFTKTIRVWFPYLLVWLLNAAWLFYYYKFGPYHSYEVTAAHTLTVSSFLWDALMTLLKVGLYIWIQILPLIFSSPLAPASLIALGLILVLPVFVYFQIKSPGPETSSASSLMVIGVIGILLGRLPSLAAGLPLTLQSSYDRFTVSMMIGGTVFIIGLIELISRQHHAKTIVFSILIALGIGQQFFNANIFRRDWEQQSEIYWQMAWRMPALKPGTLILTNQMPIDYETDISFTAPINWMYAPNFKRGDLPYLMLYTEKRIGGLTLPSFEPNTPVNFPYRTVWFHGNTSQAVVIYMPKNGCLRVLDPKRGDADLYYKEPKVLIDAIPLSDPSNIIAKTDFPASAEMFFPEPKHEWCYYFAKAELAQQAGDYREVVAFGDEAASFGYAPENQTEWLPFIEAYALTGDVQTAEKLSLNALKMEPRIKHGVCATWEQIERQHTINASEFINKLGCAK